MSIQKHHTRPINTGLRGYWDVLSLKDQASYDEALEAVYTIIESQPHNSKVMTTNRGEMGEAQLNTLIKHIFRNIPPIQAFESTLQPGAHHTPKH